MPAVAEHTSFQTVFTVYPSDTNYMDTLFGGKLMKEMDVCAGITAKRLLYVSECNRAVTAHVDSIDFTVPGHVGDLIFLTGTVISLGRKSIKIRVDVQKECEQSDKKVPMCNADFIFVSKLGESSRPHEVVLPDDYEPVI